MMIQTAHAQMEKDQLQKYAEAIWHFRGYLDKEKFDDDMEFLIEFVRQVGLGKLPEEKTADGVCPTCRRP